MKESLRVRFGNAAIRSVARPNFFVFRCYHYYQDTVNRDKYNQVFLATPYFTVSLDLKL